MAVGNAVLDVMLADGFFANVEKMGSRLRGRLEELVRRYPALYAEVRGVGLLLGLRAVVPNGDVVTRLREAGLLTAPAGDNVVRVMPPLIIDESHIDQAMAIFEQVSAAWPAGTA
jgi:acetylornithine/N-succinyldiaminopimelate aminotransferase